MPVLEVSSGKRVLVTGANGYIALWVVKILLEQGFSVRAAVRSEGKISHLKKLFGSYGSTFDWVIIEDMTKEGAFDDAVKDVDAIEHLASPLPLTTSNGDPEDYSVPAVNGTLSLFRSASKQGSQVKRIVMTSSVGAIVRWNIPQGFTFDETHWGDEFLEIVKEKGRAAPELVKYRASKVLSERAAWDFYNQHKSEIGWDLVVINPPQVIGPPLNDFESPSDLNVSLFVWHDILANEKPESVLGTTYAFIDVRDVAAAHVESLKKEEASGERIIVCQGTTTWQDTRNLLYRIRTDLYTGASAVFPRGNPDLKTEVQFKYNTEKADRILGLKNRTIEQICLDTISYFESKGWIRK